MGGVEDPLALSGAQFRQRRITVEDGVGLRLFEWRPESDHGADPIFFVAGWISLVTGWIPLLEELVQTRAVYYLETREKESAEVPERLGVARVEPDRLAELIRCFRTPSLLVVRFAQAYVSRDEIRPTLQRFKTRPVAR